MGLMDGLLGNVSEIDPAKVTPELGNVLIQGETLQKAYILIRDLILFTDRRLILIDKQGMTGKKQDVLTIPYSSITLFSKENAGTFDLDSELRIWIRGMNAPLTKQFKKGALIDDVYYLLGWYLLRDGA